MIRVEFNLSFEGRVKKRKGRMINLELRPRMIEHVKTFWEKSQDEEIGKMIPLNRGALDDAIALYEETLKPGASSFGQVIYADEKYIGDVWCYGIDEIVEKQAFVSIVIFDKAYWGRGFGKCALKQFSQLVFDMYNISKLCAFTYKENTRSIGVMESAGFHMIEEFEEDGVLSCYYERRKICCPMQGIG